MRDLMHARYDNLRYANSEVGDRLEVGRTERAWLCKTAVPSDVSEIPLHHPRWLSFNIQILPVDYIMGGIQFDLLGKARSAVQIGRAHV